MGKARHKTRPRESLDFDALLDESVEELRLKNEAHDAAWRLSEADWSIDQESGTVIFKLSDGLTAICPVQIIGTYNTLDATWLWSWANSSVVAALQQNALQVEEFGQKNGFEPLTIRKLACTEQQAWDLTALACKLCEAQGAYRGSVGDTLVFMTFGEVRLTQED
jgi:hypothetical protein